jgi:hypothetical protein
MRQNDCFATLTLWRRTNMRAYLQYIISTVVKVLGWISVEQQLCIEYERVELYIDYYNYTFEAVVES